MDRVYVVTRGCYSSYEMVAAFSTHERAEEFVDGNAWDAWDDPEIEVLPLDKWQRVQADPNRYWKVSFYDADVDQWNRPIAPSTDVREIQPDWRQEEDIPLGCWRQHWGWEVIVTAADAESAVKVAAERVAKAHAAGM